MAYRNFNHKRLHNMAAAMAMMESWNGCSAGDMWFQDDVNDDLADDFIITDRYDRSVRNYRHDFERALKSIRDVVDGLKSGKYRLEET